MRQQIKGSRGFIAVTCSALIDFSCRKMKPDPSIKCICGNVLGPILSLRAMANDEAHTAANAELKS